MNNKVKKDKKNVVKVIIGKNTCSTSGSYK